MAMTKNFYRKVFKYLRNRKIQVLFCIVFRYQTQRCVWRLQQNLSPMSISRSLNCMDTSIKVRPPWDRPTFITGILVKRYVLVQIENGIISFEVMFSIAITQDNAIWLSVIPLECAKYLYQGAASKRNFTCIDVNSLRPSDAYMRR